MMSLHLLSQGRRHYTRFVTTCTYVRNTDVTGPERDRYVGHRVPDGLVNQRLNLGKRPGSHLL